MKLSDVLARVTTLAAAICHHRAEQMPAPDPGRQFRAVRLSDLADMPTPPEWDELRRFLLAQPPAVVYLLAAVMYVGRGDYHPHDWLDVYVEMSDTFSKPATAVSQMMGKMPLAEYLADGVMELTAAGVHPDRLLGR